MSERIASLYASIGADTSGLEAGLQKTKDGVGGAVGSFTEMSSAIGLVKQGAEVLKGVFDATVGTTVQYADEVRGLSQSFSITTEEASKLIQVGDDLGVSQDTLKTAFRGMAQQGIAPSLESIKALGAQYRAITDPAERAQFALKNFGRAGLELSPILLADASAIDASAKSAQEAGQVMSGQAVADARAYSVAVDNLHDSWEGFVYTVSEKVIPVLTASLGFINEHITIQQELKQAYDQGNISYTEASALLAQYSVGATSAAAINVRLGISTSDAADASDRHTAAIQNYIGVSSSMSALDAALITDQGRLSDATITDAAAKERDAHAADLLAQATDAAARAQNDLKASQDGWVGSTADAVTSALDKAGVKGQALADAYNAIDAALGTHKAKDADQQKDIDALVQKFADGEISAKAFGSGLDDIQNVYMPHAAGALDLGKESLVEFASTTQGVNTLLGKDTPQAFLTGSGAATQFGVTLKEQYQQGGNLYVYGVGVQSLTSDINTLSAAIRNVPELAVPNSGPFGGGPLTGTGAGGTGHATGADFIVPSGFPNDSYPMRVQSGEHVVVTPAGETSSNNTPINIYNYGISETQIELLTVRIAQKLGGNY